ncbi:hypothetical protein N7U49_27420 [Streptomyces sp. AD2-2]|nr:hypothetical protein N7U49_27420 [Streptomyces sp. AD2-2]
MIGPEPDGGGTHFGEVGTVILTVTLNTALDITYQVRELRPHGSHRSSTARRTRSCWDG